MIHDPWSQAIHRAMSRANRRAAATEARRHRRARLEVHWANRYAYSQGTRQALQFRRALAYLTAEDICQLFRSEAIKNGLTVKEAHARYP